MIIQHEGIRPRIHETARIAPSAVICGDVSVGAHTSIGFGCVLTAESGRIEIGANCVVMDTAVLRGVVDAPLTIGDRVLVGPRAYLSGCTIANDVFLATGVTVFNGAVIGRRAEVRVNAVVHLRSRVEPNATVPIGWVAVGDPARILSPERHDEIWSVQEPLDFPRHVFGVERAGEGESIMPTVMPRYAARLGSHNDDWIVSIDTP